jgi:hypothetical protein
VAGPEEQNSVLVCVLYNNKYRLIQESVRWVGNKEIRTAKMLKRITKNIEGMLGCKKIVKLTQGNTESIGKEKTLRLPWVYTSG